MSTQFDMFKPTQTSLDVSAPAKKDLTPAELRALVEVTRRKVQVKLDLETMTNTTLRAFITACITQSCAGAEHYTGAIYEAIRPELPGIMPF